ncbi:MAG TPA: cysteine synthase family protein [Candidatus Ornithospirochaeta avicola]|uniref:cysteine synthase n=1 Tax=Candidatus Ornithospirochaeta avicola TaxID=2840896 RepID=A0A9D1TNY5_9SPIO|nr:cysteine synthase family protein [Candidatus Ornithospirochaeta avicola]
MSVIEKIGNTRLLALPFLGANVYAKIESDNPFGSIKDRAAFFMIQGLIEKKGSKDFVIVEATSGNTGIAASAICRELGIRIIIVMPESMSAERRNMIEEYGAELVLTKKEDGMLGSVRQAEEIRRKIKGSVSLNQFSNPDNARSHYETTAPEILSALPSISVFVSAFGTGGTVSGCARFFKEKKKDFYVVAAEPDESPLLTKGYSGSHRIQGIGANFIPENLDVSLIDEFVTVKEDDAINMARLLNDMGYPAGLSSGANACAAKMLASRWKEKNVVTVFPDSAERYKSTGLFS